MGNTEVVSVHRHVEEAVITPVGSPGVAANPVLLTSFIYAIPDDRDLVVEDVHERTDVFRVYTTIVVVFKVVGGVNTARDGTVQSELSFHLISSLDVVVVTDIVSNICDGYTVLKTGIISSGWVS